MGTLFSLSKSATSIALDISEIVLLLFGVLLTVGLIGEYAKSERWKRHVKTFEMLVIIGVAGELLADGGIFLFSSHLQTIADQEIFELTKKLGDAAALAKTAHDESTAAKAEADAAKLSAGEALTRAHAAERSLAKAEDDAGKAQIAAANALTTATDAAARAGKAEASLGKAEVEAKNAEGSASNALALAREARKELASLESDLARLKKQAADRVLSEYQQAEVAQKIELFLGTPYELGSMDAPEATDLLVEIDAALTSAGWIYKASEDKTFRFIGTLHNGKQFEYVHGRNAVQIGWNKALGVRFKPAAEALAKALNADGISAFSVALPDNDPSPNNIHVMVGSKP